MALIYNINRFFYLRKKIESKNLDKLNKLISNENPDLICLVEIKKGRQINGLISNQYNFHNIETKYGKKSILRKLPCFKNNCNGFLSKHNLEFQKHYMINGTKKLVYEIILPGDISLILTHFSLKKKVRQKQFEEIKKNILTQRKENYLLRF